MLNVTLNGHCKLQWLVNCYGRNGIKSSWYFWGGKSEPATSHPALRFTPERYRKAPTVTNPSLVDICVINASNRPLINCLLSVCTGTATEKFSRSSVLRSAPFQNHRPKRKSLAQSIPTGPKRAIRGAGKACRALRADFTWAWFQTGVHLKSSVCFKYSV